MIFDVTNFKSNAIILTLSLDDDMVVIHHITTTGDTIIERAVKYFGLFGGGKIATSFKLYPTGIFAIKKSKMFSWETLKRVIITVDVE